MKKFKKWIIISTLLLVGFVNAEIATAQTCGLSNFTVGLESTGTGPFNPGACTVGGTAHAAGDDVCTTDNVVRTNDTFIYRFNYKVASGSKEDNVTFTSTLPQVGGKTVATWDGLPPQCSGPGSSVSADGLTLVCNIGTLDQTTGGDLTSALVVQVKTNVQGVDGDLISNVPVNVATQNCTAANNPQQIETDVVISARPKADFRKDEPYNGGQTAITFGGVPGYLVNWRVYVDQFDPQGASTKGGQGLVSPITLRDVTTNFPPGSKWYDCGSEEPQQGTISCPASGTAVVNGAAGSGNLVITANAGEANQFLVAGGLKTAIQQDPNTATPQRLATYFVRIFVPLSEINAAGGQINLSNDIPATQIKDGNNVTVPDPNTGNNGLQISVTATLPGSVYKYVAKQWNASPWAGLTPGTPATSDEQIQGAGYFGDSGTGLLFPNQIFYPRLDYNNPSSANATGIVICESFNSQEVRVVDVPLYPGHGAAEYFDGILAGSNARFPQGFTVEYGVSVSEPTNGVGSRCDNTDAVWYPTLTAANGAGNREKINHVRMTVPELQGGQSAYLIVAQQARATNINGNIIEDYGSWKASNLTPPTGGAAGSWYLSTFDPATNNGLATGKRLTYTTSSSSIQKDAALSETGPSINQANAGGTVVYKLNPSLQSPVVGLPPAVVTVVDKLPAPLTYVAGSAKLGTTAFPPDSVVASAGVTTITWTIPNVTPNQPIPTLTFSAFVPQTTPPNTGIVNTAIVSSPNDASDVSQRTATKSLTVLNPPGLYILKSVAAPLINPNGTVTWKLQISNFNASPTNVDVIDVLPFVGDGRTPASAFAGTLRITGPVAPPAVGGTVRYSRAASASVVFDPVASGNTPPTAANGWCLQSEFGQPNCPSAAPAGWTEVTAFRITGVPVAANTTVDINVDTLTDGNVIGNVYTNRFYTKSDDPVLPTLRSNDVKVTVALGSITGKVYRDDNSSGVQDAGEPGIAGVTVTLCNVNTNPCPAANIVGTPQVTDASGNYKFSNLSSGNYFIFETQPSAYNDGPVNAVGSSGGTASGPSAFTAITLPVGTDAINYNFGELGSSSLIGTRKALNTVFTPVAGSPGTYDIPYRVAVKNAGTVKLNSISATDTVCGPGGTFTNTTSCAIQSLPVVTVTGTGTSATTAGSAYTGLVAGNNLLASGAVLEVGGEITIDFTVRVTLSNTFAFNNQATGTGTPTNGGAPISDLSNDGASYTSGGDTVPTGANSNVPTPVSFPLPGVSGTVYIDSNANGTRDGAGATQEPPLQGVTITLCSVSTVPCPAANVVGTPQVTDANGNYNFPNVPTGSYFIQETQPATYGSSTTNVIPITQTVAGTTNQNFGETRGRIAGFVYNDVDGSGIRSTGDLGIAGVTVTLTGTDADGKPVSISAPVTAADGSYTIDNIPLPQTGTTYTLTETPGVPTGYVNGATNVGTPNFAAGSTNTAAGTANTPASTITGIGFTPPSTAVTARPIDGVNYNFGELLQGGITGRVYVDTNTNGVNDGTTTDPGVNAVTLTLCSVATVPCPAANVVGTTTTAPDGTYTFANVPAGSYFVQETQPAQYGSSTANVVPVTRSGSGNVSNVDFGETPARISGRVYQDVNQNNTYDAGDTGIGTVKITLTGTDAAGNPVSLTTTTAADGTYTFPNVPAPNATGYTITQDQTTVPAGLANAATNPGTITPNGGAATPTGTADSPNSRVTGVTWIPPAAVVTAPQVVGQNYNFGEVQAANISGTVVRDISRNGTIDPNEPGIAGVTITLCRTNPANGVCPATDIVRTTTTGTDGTYNFTQVPAGNYFVLETQPNTLGDSPRSPNSLPVSVVNTDVKNVNFLDMPAELSGTVYRDNNNNGVRDAGEPGIAGISVTLTGTDIAGNPVSQTVQTDSNGNYIFRDLPAANTAGYTVRETTQPPQTQDSASNVGTLANAVGAAVTAGVGASVDRNTLGGIQLPPGGAGQTYNFGDVPTTAGVSGTVWRDDNHDRQLTPGEQVVPGWTVQLIRTDAQGNNPVVVATTTSDAQGRYSFTNLPAGANYQIVFRSPDARDANGQPAIYGTPVNGEQGTGTAPVPPTIANGIIQNITLVPDVVVVQQSLPLDPGGVVYDSITRQPVAGAQVTIQGPAGFNPAIHLVGGAANATQTVGASGQYQFLLLPTAPAGNYGLNVVPPTGYSFQSTVLPVTPGVFTPPGPAGGVVTIAPQPGAPQIPAGNPTTYYLQFTLTPGTSANVVNNHIPLDPSVAAKIFISKVGDKAIAELGDTLRYTIRIRRVDSGTNVLPSITVNDALPAGFRYINGTTGVNGTNAADPSGAPGPSLTFVINNANLTTGNEITLTYRVRLGVGSVEGTGVNRARAAIGTNTNCAIQPNLCSNEAQYKVQVTAGVFTKDACVVGKIYVDCNNNHVQDNEELGIPGVRMYLEDGTYLISDVEGKYSYCGLKPMTHILKVDTLTLPKGSRLTTTSNRNAGDAGSLFLDLKAGELHKADFAEGSCSNTVLEEVKARRSQGEIRAPENEKKGRGPLKFDGKAPGYPQQGTDSAKQPLVKPRESSPKSGPPDKGAVNENDTPVPQLPAASPNTQPTQPTQPSAVGN